MPSARRRRLALVAAAAAILGLYVASLGAAARLAEDNPEFRPILQLYRPVFFCFRQTETTSRALDWYLFEVWQIPRRTRPPPPPADRRDGPPPDRRPRTRSGDRFEPNAPR